MLGGKAQDGGEGNCERNWRAEYVQNTMCEIWKKIVKIMFKKGKRLNISSPDVVVTNFSINVLSKFLTSYPSHELQPESKHNLTSSYVS